jgi:hypothetical protein
VWVRRMVNGVWCMVVDDDVIEEAADAAVADLEDDDNDGGDADADADVNSPEQPVGQSISKLLIP